LYFEDLTINSGKILNMAGYRLFCSGTLTNAGHIHNDGSDGTTGSGATPGVGGDGAPFGTVGGGYVGGPGGPAEDCNGAGPNPLTSANDGGDGGTSTGRQGYSNLCPHRNLDLNFLYSTSYGVVILGSGTGGGGGGEGSYGAGGGGGGGGGGILCICARNIINSGTITTTGGDGGDGILYGGTWSYAGAGGGGGLTYIVYSSLINTGTISAAGGQHGINSPSESGLTDGNWGKVVSNDLTNGTMTVTGVPS
jgi:fibronectin-binding autotransporter adhesin